MKTQSHHSRAMQLLPLLAATFMAVASASAQQSPTVRSVSGLFVGTLLRMEESVVPFASSGAAVFVLEGTNGRDVQVSVSAMRLEQQDKSSERSEMAFTVLPELCAYSTDEGTTWNAFTSTLLQTIPLHTFQRNCTVYLRIGGKATASNCQHRGSYSGTVILTAVYK